MPRWRCSSLWRPTAAAQSLFPRIPANVTVVLHDSTFQLGLAQPYLPLARLLVAPLAPLPRRVVRAGGCTHSRRRRFEDRRRSRLAEGLDADAAACVHAARDRGEQRLPATTIRPRSAPSPASLHVVDRRCRPVPLRPASPPSCGHRPPAAGRGTSPSRPVFATPRCSAERFSICFTASAEWMPAFSSLSARAQNGQRTVEEAFEPPLANVRERWHAHLEELARAQPGCVAAGRGPDGLVATEQSRSRTRL